jgi:hypothetical protein
MNGEQFELLNIPAAVPGESAEPVVPAEQPVAAGDHDYAQNVAEVGGLIAVSVMAAIVLSAVNDLVRSRWP